MHNSELIVILKTFSKQEMHVFQKFLESPYFIKGRKLPTEKLGHLFQVLKKYHPNFESKNFNKEKIFAQLYPGSKYKDSIFRNLSSKLLLLIKEFLRITKLRTDKFVWNMSLVTEMFSRKLNKSFEKAVKECLQSFKDRKPDADYFYDRSWLADYWSAYNSRSTNHSPETVQDIEDNFVKFFLLRSLQIYMLMVNDESISKHIYNKQLLKFTLEHIRENIVKYKYNPEILVYYNLMQLFLTGEQQYFYELLKLKEKYIKSLSDLEQNNLYVCLGNYCLKEIAAGKDKFRKERFNLDKQYLESGLIDKKHFIKLPLFFSIAMNALDLNELKWVDNFSRENILRVGEEYRDFIQKYLSAEILFRRNKYHESLRRLSGTKIEIASFKQVIRNLQLKIYYELGYFDEAMLLIDTSRHFIGKQPDISTDMKEDFHKFLFYTKRLFNCKSEFDYLSLRKTLL